MKLPFPSRNGSLAPPWPSTIPAIRCVRCQDVITCTDHFPCSLKPIIRQLKSTRASRPPTGSIEIKLGLVPTHTDKSDLNKAYQEMVKRSQNAAVTLASAPPVCGLVLKLFTSLLSLRRKVSAQSVVIMATTSRMTDW